MKKFLLAVCTSTPSVKGSYTALFILMLTVPVFSQVEQTDKTPIATPFHKWEVGFDLKPLFRSDEPYNVLGKWHFTERKAVRVGLGTANWSKATDSFNIVGYKVAIVNGISDKTYEYYEIKNSNTNKFDWEAKIGYQYKLKEGSTTVYTATDLSFARQRVEFLKNGVIAGPDYPAKPFEGHDPLSNLYSKATRYRFIQSLGLEYFFNKNLSISAEISTYIEFTSYYFTKMELPYSDIFYSREQHGGGSTRNFHFQPFAGLYLNYHF